MFNSNTLKSLWKLTLTEIWWARQNHLIILTLLILLMFIDTSKPKRNIISGKKRKKERKEALWIKVFFSDSYLCNYRMTSHAMKLSPVCEAAIPLGVWASILIGFLHTWPGKVFSSWGMDSTSPSPDGSSPFSHSVRHSSDTDDSGKWLFSKKSVLIHFFLFYDVCWVHHTTQSANYRL